VTEALGHFGHALTAALGTHWPHVDSVIVEEFELSLLLINEC